MTMKKLASELAIDTINKQTNQLTNMSLQRFYQNIPEWRCETTHSINTPMERINGPCMKILSNFWHGWNWLSFDEETEKREKWQSNQAGYTANKCSPTNGQGQFCEWAGAVLWVIGDCYVGRLDQWCLRITILAIFRIIHKFALPSNRQTYPLTELLSKPPHKDK